MPRRLAVAVLAVALLVPIAALAAGSEPQLAQALTATGGTLTYDDGTGLARFYSAAPGSTDVSAAGRRSPEAVARRFLDTYGPLFGIDDVSSQLSLAATDASRGQSTVRFTQVHDGVPVIGGELVVQVAGGQVTTVTGETAPTKGAATEPTISAEAAADIARQAIGKAHDLAPEALLASTPELAIYYPPLLGPGPSIAVLVWRMDVTAALAPLMREHTLVDAVTGSIALHFDSGARARYRAIHDSNGTGAQGALARAEGDIATGDAEVDTTYDFVGDFYDYYSSHFGRDGFDDNGATLVASVSFDDGSCPNAYWNGTQTIFCEGMATDDVVGHEFSHAVTQYTSGLYYYYQSGALDEGLADIFGELIDIGNGSADDTAGNRWLVGEGSALGPLRDLEQPGSLGNPDSLTSSYWVCDYHAADSGGVHGNSTVLGKAASLLADGGTHYGSTIAAIGADKMAAIFYEMQAHLLTSGSDYSDVHEALPQACRNLLGSIVGGSAVTTGDCAQVEIAVDATAMDQTPAVCGMDEAPYCPEGKTCTDLYFDDLEHPGNGLWTSYAISGSNVWYYPQTLSPYDATYATSGTTNAFGFDAATAGNSAIAMTGSVLVPAGTQAYLRFNHSYLFEFGSSGYYDGGVVEYSIDGGSAWYDAGSLFDANGYRGTLSTHFGNPLGGRSAFVAGSLGYTSSRLNLAGLAGKSVRFRFRIGTDSSTAAWGWFIDDIRIYTAGAASPTPTPAPTPAGLSVSVNGGALYTKSAGVTLGLTALAGYTEMRVSNDGGFTGASWEPFAATKAWQLTEYGISAIPRTVYVGFRGGSVAEATRSDDIILDRAAPTGSVRATLSGSGLAASGAATLQLSASDDASGVAGMMLADDAEFSGAAWRPYAGTATWSGSGGTVYVRFRDGAGNESAVYSTAYVAQPQRYLPLLQ